LVGSPPQTPLGELTLLPQAPLAEFKEPTSKGSGGMRGEGTGRLWERKGRKGGEEWEGDSFGPRSGPPTFWRIYAHVKCNSNIFA